jgi:hypothetical protein
MEAFMKFLISFIFSLLFVSFSYAEEESKTCKGSALLEHTHLSCMSCALEKKGLPVPDDRFLASLGFAARENTLFLPKLETGSRRLKFDSPYVQAARKKDGSLYLDKQGNEVSFTVKNQYHNYVMEMLLASGYCAKDAFKKASKDEKYKELRARMNSEKFVDTMSDKLTRYNAARELGANSWEELSDTFFVSTSGKGNSFPNMSFAKQRDELKKRRIEYLKKNQSIFQSDYSSTSGPIGSQDFYTNCFQNIEKAEVPTEIVQNKSREICTAIYDECGIPQVGNPCLAKYPPAKEPLPKKITEEIPAAASQPKTVTNDKIEPSVKPTSKGNQVPVVDKATYGTMTLSQKADGCWYNSKGEKVPNFPCVVPDAVKPSVDGKEVPKAIK